jgi:hypothetical protein
MAFSSTTLGKRMNSYAQHSPEYEETTDPTQVDENDEEDGIMMDHHDEEFEDEEDDLGEGPLPLAVQYEEPSTKGQQQQRGGRDREVTSCGTLGTSGSGSASGSRAHLQGKANHKLPTLTKFSIRSSNSGSSSNIKSEQQQQQQPSDADADSYGDNAADMKINPVDPEYIISFIHRVKTVPYLYNPDDENFRNVAVKQAAWKQISEEFQQPRELKYEVVCIMYLWMITLQYKL